MSSFGENLRREREMRGVSLQEIAQTTKIGARMLDAIETERFDSLPGGVFNRGFVRQYARYLGLDEDQALAEFELAYSAVLEQGEQKSSAAKRAVPLSDGEDGAHNLPLLILLGLVGAGALVVGGWRLWGRKDAVAPSFAKASESRPSPLVSGTSVAAPVATSKAAAAKELKLQIDAVDRCWVSVSVDGQPASNEELSPGSSRTVKAARSLELIAGNAGALVLTLNGKTLPPLGRKGEVKKAAYTSADLPKEPGRGENRP